MKLAAATLRPERSDDAVTFQVQIVFMANLYVPAFVKGCWPPPPRPVWRAIVAAEAFLRLEVSTKL